jgi:hypothetical protein
VRRRVLVVVTLLAALLVPSGLVAAAGESSPTRALRLHYRHIAQGEFRTAYALFTPAAKRQLGPYARWRAGYRETGQVTVYDLRRSGTKVRFGLTSCRGDGDREVTIEERFIGTWPTRKVQGRWFLDAGARITRTSRRETTSCRLPVP